MGIHSIDAARKHRERMSKSDPTDIPLYSAREAARFVGVPPSTLQKWLRGREYPAGGTIKWSKPLITPANPKTGELSFANLAEAHILDATRKARIPMADVRAAIDMLQSEHSYKHPLLSGRFYKIGKRMFVEYLNQIVSASRPTEGQPQLGDLLEQYLERITRDENDRPIRLFPMRYNESKRVVLNFDIAAGQPVVTGTGILVEFLNDLHQAGTSIPKIARQYDLDEFTVAEAIHYIAA